MDAKILVVIALVTFLLIGCINNKEDKVIELAKKLPEVQDFLNENPDATMRVNLLGKDVIEDNIYSLRHYCGQGMEIKNYWDVIFERGDKGVEVLVSEEEEIVCILERGKEVTTTFTPTTTYLPTTTTLSKNLKVHFIDVGEGEAILLEKEGKFGLIDCGNDYRKVYLYLFKRNISWLDFLIVTNPKVQHLGACDVVLENFKVGEIFDSGQGYAIEEYREYIKLAAERNHKVVQRGNQINFNNVFLNFLWPPVTHPSGDIEGNSIVIKLSYGEIDVLLTSDCDMGCENQLQGDLSSEILKVGHQGSKESTSSSFLNEVDPEVAIISTGYGNPSLITLSKLEKIEVHRTDLEGSIVIETNGVNYLVFPEHEPRVPTTTVPPIVTTTTATTTSTTTSTTTPTTSTSVVITTPTTTTLIITTSIATTSSTICTVECCSDWDCPDDKTTKNYTCFSEEIRRQYIDYICRYAGSPSAECIGKMKSDFIKSCTGEKEVCLEDEPYCSFFSWGEYHIIQEIPEGATSFYVNNENFHPYLHFWLKVKYVISDLEGEAPDGLCLYVKESQTGEVRREYITDKFFGNWINESVRVGVKKVFIGSGISVEVWGISS